MPQGPSGGPTRSASAALGALLERLAIPREYWDWIADSWRRGEPHLYGRMDLAYDGRGPAKLYELNYDTPTSLYEAQTNRILCPCHQSQFDALHYGKPVFGPAARALPQLPIAVDEEGYMYAKGNFVEPVGPAFWERRS